MAAAIEATNGDVQDVRWGIVRLPGWSEAFWRGEWQEYPVEVDMLPRFMPTAIRTRLGGPKDRGADKANYHASVWRGASEMTATGDYQFDPLHDAIYVGVNRISTGGLAYVCYILGAARTENPEDVGNAHAYTIGSSGIRLPIELPFVEVHALHTARAALEIQSPVVV